MDLDLFTPWIRNLDPGGIFSDLGSGSRMGYLFDFKDFFLKP
jgi:hypothetical protein